jgi:bifunctional UDP-N-acetylglucosamine pyrophosphorylase/glucosamine-1-phosphate N-acetyltransferase
MNMKNNVMNKTNTVQVIILAGGKGTRMEADGPKALTLLAGKPFLQHILDTISLTSFVCNPVIVVGYMKEYIYEKIGLNHTYAVQYEQLGTGDAVKSAKEKITDPNAPVIILYADHPHISVQTIEKLIEKQAETKLPIVMATTTIPHYGDWYQAFTTWGRIVRNEMGDIIKNIEYKDTCDSEKEICEVNPCFFAFDGAWLWPHLDIVKNENAQNEYYLTDLVKIAFEEGYIIPSVPIPPEEAIGVNSKKELEILENIYKEKNK